MYVLYEGQEAPEPTLMSTSRTRLFERMYTLLEAQEAFSAVSYDDEGRIEETLGYGYEDADGFYRRKLLGDNFREPRR